MTRLIWKCPRALLISWLWVVAVSAQTKDEILQRHCTFSKGLHPNLIRFVTKEGYHREIEDVVEVTFTNSLLSTGDFIKGKGCKFAMLAKFTGDLYVDPYEIRNIPELKGVRVLNEWTDLEGPAWDSKTNSTVFIVLQSNPTGNLITTEHLRLPIHFRYQTPLSHSRFKERLYQAQISSPGGSLVNPAGYVKVVIPLPRLLLRCDDWNHPLIEDKCHVVKTLCSSKSAKDELCEWIPLPFKSNSKQGSTVFIPVGDTDQTLLVSSITILVVVGGTIFILHTLVRAKEKLDDESQPQDNNDKNNANSQHNKIHKE